MKPFDLSTIFRFDEYIMKYLNIPFIKQIDDNEELWKYVHLDHHKKFNKERRYMISTYGRVYDIHKKKLVYIEKSSTNSKGEYYLRVTLEVDYMPVRYLVHRLVALAFITIDEERPFVNHKDGHPSHNYVWNLEWVTNSENMIHAIKTGLKQEQRGEQRSNSLWTDDEIRMICEMMEEGHKATYIYHALGDILKDQKVQYERVRTLYKHIIHQTHWTHISKDYNINFTRFNYSKERGSVNAKILE